ncbi:MAG: cytidine deaminase [Firmicutes bacterium]|nr:cytidine deaminase [Bacillota bacterium]
MNYKTLLERAKRAAENSYSPYSGFKVGAALLLENGDVITGCNAENAAFSPSICAERAAVAAAVSAGYRHFKAIAIWGGKNPCYPCGVCRQTLAEFCGGDFEVILSGADGGIEIHKLTELLPFEFKL